MRISFCIPTYNRAKYLAICIEKIARQIEELGKEAEVEINLSNNASTDNTKEVWDKAVVSHPNIKFTYKCNEKNLGPDGNFLSAMNMATGEYSLLWGDDDYLKEGGLKRIYELIEYGEQNDVQIMVSSTSLLDEFGNYIGEKPFLRPDVDSMLVDFTNVDQVCHYFFLLRDMGGMLSFISDVIYKTSIIRQLPYHEEMTGTHYAFLNYWWGVLADGGKLYYSSNSFIDETIQYQPAYGFGIRRQMVDYNGYEKVANYVLNNVSWKKDFLDAFSNIHSYFNARWALLADKKDFEQIMLPKMREFGAKESEISKMYQSSTRKDMVKCLLYTIIPNKYTTLLKKIIKK